MNAFESRLDENILILGRGWMDRTRLTAEEDMIIPRLARLATNQRRDPLAPRTRDRGGPDPSRVKPSLGLFSLDMRWLCLPRPPVLSNISSFNNRYDPSNICLITIPQAGNHNNIIPIPY